VVLKAKKFEGNDSAGNSDLGDVNGIGYSADYLQNLDAWSPSTAQPGASSAQTGGALSDASGGVTTQTVSTTGSGLVFNNTYATGDSAQYITCIVAAEQKLESLFTNKVTLNITFNAQASGTSGDLATNSWPSFVDVSFTQLKSKLPASDVLPSTDPNPAGGNDWALPEAYARMLGLSTSTPGTDDTVTLDTSWNWSYGQDVTNTLEHEISEGAMGRVGGLGDQNSVWSTMDLFRYSSPGVHDYTDGRDGITTYFSSNGTTLSTLSFNNEYNGNTKENSGDTADFIQQDVFGTGDPGETNVLSPTDLSNMYALGWTSARTSTPDNFTGNGTSDILLQGSSGALVDWILQNGTLSSGDNINNPALSGYSVVHDSYSQLALTGDFNGDGTSDILLQSSNGTLIDWIIKNGTLSSGNNINNPAAYGYSVVGTGDFNGDGTTDLLLQNSSGNLVDWTMKNGALSGGNNINNPALYGYSLVGTGDFNGDGTTDLLLQNSSGNLVDWTMQNGTLSGGNNINNPSLYGYALVGTGDFNGDGTTDLLLQNSSGNLVDWIMQNGMLSGGNNINNPSLYGYSLLGTGDYNGDGTTDLLLQNSSGNLVDWTMKNGTLSGGNNINNPTLYSYHVA
jgi:hypothetical protein